MQSHHAQAPRRLAAAAPSGGPRLYPFGRRSSAMERAHGTRFVGDRRGLVAVGEDPAAMTAHDQAGAWHAVTS